MNKPQPKTETKIRFVGDFIRFITFYASPDAAEDFAEFGAITSTIPGFYNLLVDARYDFREVVAYIESYSSQEGNDGKAP